MPANASGDGWRALRRALIARDQFCTQNRTCKRFYNHRQGRVVLRRRPVTNFEFLKTLVLESGTSTQNIQTESLLQFGEHLEHPRALIVTVFHSSATLESIKKFWFFFDFFALLRHDWR
jgi:hypothetical protein